MKVSKTGYKKNSKDKNQPSLLIPSNRITMKDVEFPVLGMDNYGNQQMMYPGQEYSFPGDYVIEKPMKNWLNKYQEGGEPKPMSWTEYLDSLGITDPKLRNIDPRTKLYSNETHEIGKGSDLSYDNYMNAAMERPHTSNVFEDADNLKAGRVIDMYNALFWNREKQDYSGSDRNKYDDELPSNKVDIELSPYADHSMDKKDALAYIKKLYNTPTEDIISESFDEEAPGFYSRAFKDIPIEYTRSFPRVDLTMYNNPNWERDNPLFSRDKSIEVFGQYDSMPLTQNFDEDWTYNDPKAFNKDKQSLEFQAFPKPTYNYVNVPKRYDEKGNEVVSKYDIPNPQANTYYDFSGSLTEDIYNQKNMLHNIYKQNVENLKKFDPNASLKPSDRDLRREYIEKEYASDPYLFYGDQNTEDRYCVHCERLSGSEHTTSGNIDFFKFKPQYPSSKEWIQSQKPRVDREIIQVRNTPNPTHRTWSQAVQDKNPGMGTQEYATTVRIGTDMYPVTHTTDKPYGEFEVDGKKQYITYEKNPEGGYNPVISETKPATPKVIKAPTFKSGGWLDTYDTMTPAWSKNPEGNWVVKAQNGLQYIDEPTRADSLELLKNSRMVLDYYKSKNYTQGSQQYLKNARGKNEFMDDTMSAHEIYDPTQMQQTPTGLRLVPLNEYYKPVDNNKFYQRELAYGILDTNSPMVLYDKRIQPTTVRTYRNDDPSSRIMGDVAVLGMYDPLSITPWDMLTDKQKKLRVKRFGRDGVPESYDPDRPAIPENIKPLPIKLLPLQGPEDRLIREYNVLVPNEKYKKVYDKSPYSTKEYGPEGMFTHWAKEDEKIPGIWRPIKGTPSDLFVTKKVKYQKGGVHQKIYTDPDKFAKANKLYNDSLDLYTKGLAFNKKHIPTDNYNTFSVPYDDVYWTAAGPGGYFIDTPSGRWFLGKTGVFSVPGSEHNKIFTESFTNKIKPIGFDTVDWPYPVYKKPTQQPVYKEEIKNLPYLDAKFERPDFKLDIGRPAVKSQGIRIRPMMTADQNTRTGQYQSGKYIWDPQTKSWKVQILSPEAQQENREEVKLKSKKNGGWLEQYQDGRQFNKYDIMSGVYDDMRQAAVPSTTYVDIPAPTEKEVKAVQAEAQRVKKKMKQTGAKSEAEVYAKEKAEKEFQNAAATIAANQGVIDVAKEKTAGDYISQAWDVASNPATALGYKIRGQEIPWGFAKGEKNVLDTPLSLINPATYINAAGRLVDAAVTPETYTQVIPQTIGATAMTLSGDQYPTTWDENAWKMLGLGLDAAMLKGNPFRIPGKYAIGYQSPSGARAALGDLEYIAANNPKLLGSLETPYGKWALAKANPVTETGLVRFTRPAGAQGSSAIGAAAMSSAFPASTSMRALPGSPNVPDEFMVQARAAGAQGPPAPKYFTNDEVQLQADQIKNYNEARKAFNKKYPSNYLFDKEDPIVNWEMREEMFNLLYPNVKVPKFNSKEYLPKHFDYINNLLKESNKSMYMDSPFMGHKSKELSRLNLESKLLKDSVKSEQPVEFMYMDDLRQEALDPDSWLNTDPRGYLDEFSALPENADELTDQEIRDLAERKHMARMIELEMKIQEKYGNNTGYTNLISTGKLPFTPEGMNSIIPTGISNKVKSMPLVKKAMKAIDDGIYKFLRTPVGGSLEAHRIGLNFGKKELTSKYSNRTLGEIFPITKSQKQKVFSENQDIRAVGERFLHDWGYDKSGNIRPDVALRIQNILGPINYIPNYRVFNDINNPLYYTPNKIVNTRNIKSSANKKLSDSDTQRIIRNRGVAAGVNFAADQKNPGSFTFENFGFYNLPFNSKLETFIHEGGHTYQQLGAKNFIGVDLNGKPMYLTGDTWIDQLIVWDPVHKYFVPNKYTKLGRRFGKAMTDPSVDPWRSSVGELHSELMTARFNLLKAYMKQGYSYDEAMDILKKGTNRQMKWMIENQKLNQFFKSTTKQKEKYKLMRMLPVALPIGLGIGAAAASNKKKYQDGGDYNKIPQSWKDTYNWTPNVEEEYQQFKNDPNAPENLRFTDDMKDYNTRGMWDSLDRPSNWQQALDLFRQQQGYDWMPEDDGYYHAWSQHPGTGEWLKPRHHSTGWMNYMGYAFDPNTTAVVNPEGFFENDTLQAYPRKKKGGVKSSAEGYYDYINGYSGIFAKGGTKGWLDNYK